ncbi:MAG: DUF669 domain-containing protein [Negativicutes bacterium]
MGIENERELGWDDEIQKDSPDFVLLPAGEYDFEVISFERARYAGGDKLPPCNQAKLKLRIETPEGITTVSNNLFLHSRTEGLLSAFFNCIGQKKHGEKVQMNWGQVVGAKGRAKIGIHIYDGKEFNEVKDFLDPVDAPPVAPATGKGWTPGKL